MSQFTMKGDLKTFSEKQLQFVNETLEKLNLKKCNINIQPLGKAGDNYASDVKIIKIDTSETESFNIIVKLNPNIGLQNTKNFITSIFFNNEIIMYTEVLPLMVELQKASGVPMEEIYRYPSCYGTSRENGQEIILLEDLSKENYIMLDKFKPLSNDTIKVILRDLARFHSLSYVIRNRKPEIFSDLIKKFTDISTVQELDDQQKNMKILGENLSKIFDKQKYKNNVQAILYDHASNMKKLIKSDIGTNYTVVIHGDSWTNNMLFKVNDGVPETCVLIDYQIARESLPVADILYLIFNCTDYKAISNYFHDWIDFYHTELENNLFYHGLKVTNIYPRDKLDSDLKRYAKSYLGLSMLVLSILLRQTDESAEVKEAMAASDMDGLSDILKITHLQEISISKMRERIEGLIDSCIELGFLNANV